MGSSVNIAVTENFAAAGAVDKCVGCNLCVRECSFLQRTGNPGELAEGMQEYDPFECTLCGLCTAVCPVEVNPAKFFLERRREIRRSRGSDDRRHSPLIAYERKGTSPLFTFYGLPEGCDVVFFPGCALPGSRPKAVEEVYRELRKQIPRLGMVLDCCLKPSHDLGREDHFNSSFGEIREYLKSQGIRKVLVACPNCNRIFSDYGEGLAVQTVYELLADVPSGVPELSATEAVFHDPCVARCNRAAQEASRSLVKRAGVRVAEMKHARDKTLCCGRGGGVNFIRPEVVAESVASRVAEAGGRPIVTYCASCAGTFQQGATALHVLDLWMAPKEALAGRVKVSAAPMTYLNRLLLKRKFRRSGEFAIMRDRGGSEMAGKGSSKLKAAAVVAVVVALAAVARCTGAVALLDPEHLRQLVQGHEVLGPLLFILLYSLTPVLFLPGLPMALAAGVLFGPVWGVVYAITGATIGASLSFLVARHLAREWVEAKLTAEMWKNLDRKVGEQGWKIVAITRLVPLFPFNLLNYAFGITKIPFGHYVITSFFCMLPACIAFITFSSSLPQLLKGQVSPTLIAGLVFIFVVMMIPRIYRKKTGNGQGAIGAKGDASGENAGSL